MTSSSNKQLSLDIGLESPPENKAILNEEMSYEALDYQLADLLQELSGLDEKKLNEKKFDVIKILNQLTLEISKKTREGCIAIPCSKEQQQKLLLTDVVGQANEFKPLILDNDFLFLRRYWQYQRHIADQIQSRREQLEFDNEEQAWQKDRLDFYFKTTLSDNANSNHEPDWQRQAAESALKNKFLIITGGPGTGKTTTITRILVLLIEAYIKNKKSIKNRGGGYNSDFNILLAAPTGKASIRMLDSIRNAQQSMKLSKDIQTHLPLNAYTIHKLLGHIPDSINFKYNRNNPLPADVVLVDEASMIDIALMSKLIEAIPPHAKLILIGDKDQLASVETGSVFTDMCRSLAESQYLVSLLKNWRFSEKSGIGKLANAANQGDIKTLLAILNDEKIQSCQLLSPLILNKKLVAERLLSPWNNYFEQLKRPDVELDEIFEAFNQYRILCTLRKSVNGSVILNNRIEITFMKHGFIKPIGRQRAGSAWYHGRPVMITQNYYNKGLNNGDTGITLIKNGEVKVYFPSGQNGEYSCFSPIRLPAHETAWAMTIHKSQGSEFDQVTLVLPHESMPLLTRQLIYTGITRAKEKVSLVASEDILIKGVKAQAIQATRIGEML